MYCPHKNDSHPISVGYCDDQFTLRFQEEGNTVAYTPLDSFSFQSVSSFLIKHEKLTRNKVKTLFLQNRLSNGTDALEDDDPVTKRIPQ